MNFSSALKPSMSSLAWLLMWQQQSGREAWSFLGPECYWIRGCPDDQCSAQHRLTAVVVREHCLKLHHECKNIRQPTDIIRHLEDEFSRAEAKLTNFSKLKLSEADRCSVFLQALEPEVRLYVLLHGSSLDWDSLRKSLTYYEEQLRLCKIPVSNRALNTDLLCDYCG